MQWALFTDTIAQWHKMSNVGAKSDGLLSWLFLPIMARCFGREKIIGERACEP
jgi:hypothetical protein